MRASTLAVTAMSALCCAHDRERPDMDGNLKWFLDHLGGFLMIVPTSLSQQHDERVLHLGHNVASRLSWN